MKGISGTAKGSTATALTLDSAVTRCRPFSRLAGFLASPNASCTLVMVVASCTAAETPSAACS